MTFEDFIKEAERVSDLAKMLGFNVAIVAEGVNEMNTHIETHCMLNYNNEEISPLFNMVHNIVENFKQQAQKQDDPNQSDLDQLELPLFPDTH